MKETMKVLMAGIFLVLLATGCPTEFFMPSGEGGNVTITLDTTARTLRPNDIAAATVFERVELEFSKVDGTDTLIKILTLKGVTSGNINLEVGTWNINALGFMKIEEREYEAAQGSAVVNVSSSPQTVPIVLQTGILNGKPGVFSYDINFPGTVTDAVLEINSLPDLHGYEISSARETVNLIQGKTGSFELLPGYYLLTLSAKTAATMAVWNELVHIYSGQETTASHTFEAADFSGTVTLSGTVTGGEFDGNHITGAIVTVYGDENFLNRIASVNVSGFTKMPAAPYYYSSSWSITVPGSLVGKEVYFRLEETLSGPAGDKTYVWDGSGPSHITVSSGGDTNIDLDGSYFWYKYIENGNSGAVNYTVGSDGTITVTTTETVAEEWDAWRQNVGFKFPAENNVRYAYEFEAWTQSGERPLNVQHITNNKYEIYRSENFTINTTRQTFTVVSGVRFDPNTLSKIEFQLGHPSITGTLYIKLKSIKSSDEYIPPAVGDTPRFTATATSGGIRLRADLRGLPDALTGLAIYDSATITHIDTGSIWNEGDAHTDFYEILFPYVQAGKEYTFRLEYRISGSISLGSPLATVTATGGRGELVFVNSAGLAVVKDGNTVKFNTNPVLSSAFNEPNAADERYVFQMATGTSWADRLAQWRYSYSIIPPDNLAPIDLIEILEELPWVNVSGFLGRTCFAELYYAFSYDGDDVYIEGHPEYAQRATFRTGGVFSTPFTYPNILPNMFIAEPHPEGVKLTIDITRFPTLATALYITVDPNSAQLWIDSWDWENGRFFEQNTIEIIYPFVQSGKSYTFQVSYEGSGAFGQATATATGGLGELNISNTANMGLIYNTGTKTLSLTDTPTVSSIVNSPDIEEKYWEWQFFKGYNWDNSEWKGSIPYYEPVKSVVLDKSFNPAIGSALSNANAFVSVTYRIQYRGITFYRDIAVSPSFRFPYFDPSVGTWVRTAFDTNNDLYIQYWDFYMTQWDSLNVYVNYWGNDNSYISYTWFIDGDLQEGYTDGEVSLSMWGLSPGIHYGLVVVTIDGAAFAKEFAFRVWDKE